MATYYIANACSDENSNLRGGVAGDQKQTTTSTNDYRGEVKLSKFYIHRLGWNVYRPIDPVKATALANAMIDGCNNKHIGYDQSNRNGVYNYVKNGTKIAEISKNTETDCSGLVRAAYVEAYEKDIPSFTTYNEDEVLMATGDFKKIRYISGMKLYIGDVLCTPTKGHTGVIGIGNARVSYYPMYEGKSGSIVTALRGVGEPDTSYAHRAKIAKANCIENYGGTYQQNTTMVNLLKAGRLIKA